jgi:hypothetical protein
LKKPIKIKHVNGVKELERYLLMDLERTLISGVPCYWKSNRYGYTYEIEHAGIFSKDLAEEIAKNDYDQKTVLVPYKLIFDLGLKAFENEGS